MSDNNDNTNADLLLVLNQLREQVATLAADVNELKNGPRIENEAEEEDNASVKSQAIPNDPLRQKMEKYLKMFEASPMFKDSFSQYDNYVTQPKSTVPIKFSVPESVRFTRVEYPHHHVKSFLHYMAAKGIERDVFHLVFPWTFNQDVTMWYHALDAQKTNSWDELCREFINQYSCNTEAPFTLLDLEMIKQEGKESFNDFLIRWRSKAAHMSNRPTEVDQVAMIVQGLKPAYQHYLEFANISTISDLKRLGTKAEENIAVSKTNYTPSTTWRSNYQPKNTKTTNSSNQGTSKGAEVSALTRYAKYAPLAITYTEALDRLIQKNLVKLPDIKPEPEVKSKSWDPAKYCKYHRARGHDTEACWTF